MRIYIQLIVLLLISSFTLANAQENMKEKQQEKLVTIVAFAVKGNLDQLNKELNAGLDAGLTVNEVKEMLVHSYAYAGFPRAIRGLQTLMSVLEERKAKGITDEWGREASPIVDRGDKYERGKNILAEISGTTPPEGRPTSGYANFSPEIETFLKEHLFADIFERDVLTYAQREMVTISILTSLGGAEPMLRSHMNIGLKVGITPDELKQIINTISRNVSDADTESARQIMSELFINEDRVNPQRVSFRNRINIHLVGNLYYPPNFDINKKYPAIVVGHTFTGVKEQTSGLHARKLAELGYITLAFDASFWGESGGSPRNIEVPEIRVEDFSAAVDYLSNHSMVDLNRIGGLGICGGGGYVVSAAAIDHRIKAVATVSMYDLGRSRRQGLGDAISYEQRMKTLDLIGELRTKEFRGEARTNTLGVPEEVTSQDTENTREFYDYYRTSRAQHPNTNTSYSLTSQAPMMNFFPFVQIETISPRPLLFIVGERAVSAYFSEEAYKKASEPKELFVVPNASHVDLYDKPEYLATSIPKLDSFFKEHLR